MSKIRPATVRSTPRYFPNDLPKRPKSRGCDFIYVQRANMKEVDSQRLHIQKMNAVRKKVMNKVNDWVYEIRYLPIEKIGKCPKCFRPARIKAKNALVIILVK